MKCPKCQAENPEGSAFCRKCGQPLSSELVCPQCKHVNLADSAFCNKCGQPLAVKSATDQPTSAPMPSTPPSSIPTSFANGRYQVKKFLGEGGKKKVYLAHDEELDRDVAFALIKTEKLDQSARTRIKREAQAMGKLGDHPNVVSIFDIGDHAGQPYIVIPFMAGGDVEGLVKKAPDHKLPIDRSIEIAKCVCRGLEFAHAKGIIHRDIKPGNIWLNAEGTAQIGDFGLAVAVDRSRLTQAGMMVGTVSYMPPEQAMGGEVTARADLYSLGAMLYEMVTGRPPFVGDDSVAIIGQHVNTPPVSPFWHRADLPPALETLIMQLLEKDPERRPASATVVLQALESVATGNVGKEQPRESSAPVENPLYRRVFVGREQELKTLQSAFDGAASGQGALWMVLGEPGIGKTALCEQLSTYVALRGGKTLVGHCYEEGSLSLPYLAFVEAMRSYVLDRGAEDLKNELGSGASDLARIVSDIREKLHVEPRAAENPEEDRYRLMQGVSSFLTHAAAVKPLLIILEDLHDADRGSLEMLTYVSRNLGGARLLVVGTYRDVEVDRTHPLSAALAELRRGSSFGRVVLRGLNADEVSRMLKSIIHDDVPWGLAQAIHKQTEGNPLFVKVVVRYLTEQKLLIRAGGKMIATGPTPVEMSIPEGLRDVIGKRLSSLSEACNRLLSIAAVIGREFRLDVLQKVSGLSEDEVFKSIEEAKRVAVVEERSAIGGAVTYRFAHAFFRTILYEETIAPRRIRLHQQVARALEEVYANRLPEHAAELAEHFSYSTDTSDLAKAVSYGEMAARRATDVYDYGEAARLLEQALKVQEVLDPADRRKQCDLLLSLCDALLGIPDTRRVINSEADAAFKLAESLGDDLRAARACRAALWAIGLEQAGPGYTSAEYADWAKRADAHAPPGTIDRAYTDYASGTMRGMTGDFPQGQKLLVNALDLARCLGDKDTYFAAGSMLLLFRIAPQRTEERLRLAEELWRSSESGIPGREARCLAWIGDTFLAVGLRRRAEETFAKLRLLAGQRPGDMLLGNISDVMDATLAIMDGRLEESLHIAEKAQADGEAAGVADGARMWTSTAFFRAGVNLGIPMDEFLSKVREPNRTWLLSLAHAYQKRRTDELSQLDAIAGRDEAPGWMMTIALETAVLTGRHAVAAILLERLRGTGVRTSGFWYPTCVGRHLGAAAALLERYDEALQHYQEAIRVCAEMRFRPELALTRLQLAELLLDHYPAEKKEALEHLDFSIKEFREMKMQPSLERALRRKEILKA